jgi:hypothetical protein
MKITISLRIIQWTLKRLSMFFTKPSDFRMNDETNKIKQVVSFYSEQWSKKRSVTSLDWSPKACFSCTLLMIVP